MQYRIKLCCLQCITHRGETGQEEPQVNRTWRNNLNCRAEGYLPFYVRGLVIMIISTCLSHAIQCNSMTNCIVIARTHYYIIIVCSYSCWQIHDDVMFLSLPNVANMKAHVQLVGSVPSVQSEYESLLRHWITQAVGKIRSINSATVTKVVLLSDLNSNGRVLITSHEIEIKPLSVLSSTR